MATPMLVYVKRHVDNNDLYSSYICGQTFL
jgi:hypothetical protein